MRSLGGDNDGGSDREGARGRLEKPLVNGSDGDVDGPSNNLTTVQCDQDDFPNKKMCLNNPSGVIGFVFK